MTQNWKLIIINLSPNEEEKCEFYESFQYWALLLRQRG